MVDKNQKQKSFEEGYMKGTEYLHEAMKESASSERERILKIIEEHKHKIENDSDFWEKWINETLEQVRAEIEKEE